MNTVRIWDLPVRIFHWVFTLGFATAFAIAKIADDESPAYTIHMVLGLVVAGAVLLRIVWGLAGSRTGRFSSFVLRPRALVDYFLGILRRGGRRYAVRNPAASWAALVMGLLALGLVASGASIPAFGHDAKEVHEFFAISLLVVGLLHVVGVVFHAIRHGDRLALSMVHGKNDVDGDVQGVSASGPAAAVFVVLLALWAGTVLKNRDPQSGTLRVPALGVTIDPEKKGRGPERGEEEHEEGSRAEENVRS